MSRWATAFHAHKAADTVDTVDTVAPSTGLPPHSVNSVNSVMPGIRGAGAFEPPLDLPPASPMQAADEQTDRTAIEAEPLLRRAVAAEPPPEMVEALAQAMAANPAHRITDRGTAMLYFRAQARRRLRLTDDPIVRGLLLGFERHRNRFGGVAQAQSRIAGGEDE